MVRESEATEDEAFAIAVFDLYTRIRKGIPEEVGTKISSDVAAIAFPLATLRAAIDALHEHVLENKAPGKVKSSGIMPALHLLDSLMRGTEHPFWRYSRAVTKMNPHRKPPSEVEVMRRAMAVGLLRALMRAGSLKENRAAAMVATECTKHALPIRVGQLRDWNADFQTTRADDPEPDRCAQRFQTIAGKPSSDTKRILMAGMANLDEFFGKLKR
jgi:hypothetical protein